MYIWWVKYGHCVVVPIEGGYIPRRTTVESEGYIVTNKDSVSSLLDIVGSCIGENPEDVGIIQAKLLGITMNDIRQEPEQDGPGLMESTEECEHIYGYMEGNGYCSFIKGKDVNSVVVKGHTNKVLFMKCPLCSKQLTEERGL